MTRVRQVIVTATAIFSLLAIGVAPAAARKPTQHHRHAARACQRATRRHPRRRACAASRHRNHRRSAAKHNRRTAKPDGRSRHTLGTSTAVSPHPSGTPSTSPAPTPAPAPAPAPVTRPVASTAPCANTDLTPDPTNIPIVEAATLCLVNQVRGQHGLPGLAPNADLQSSADLHNNDMVTQDYFAHDGPGGDSPLSRIRATGYLANDTVSWVVGENIAWGTLSLSTPAAIVNAWVNSPEHLANILDGDYTDSGLAVAPQAPASMADGQQGAIYTQDFGGVDSSGD